MWLLLKQVAQFILALLVEHFKELFAKRLVTKLVMTLVMTLVVLVVHAQVACQVPVVEVGLLTDVLLLIQVVVTLLVTLTVVGHLLLTQTHMIALLTLAKPAVMSKLIIQISFHTILLLTSAFQG
jgi:hypothetical protein